MKTNYFVLGAMAGSSMDGLDLVLATFRQGTTWSYTIHKTQTVPYPSSLIAQLSEAPRLPSSAQHELDRAFGEWMAHQICAFVKDETPELLAIHGHTVVHQPEKKISWQLGDGATIASIVGVPTVTSFRTLDVQKGGQGAPLVPMGDFDLFTSYDACLNLGGIANISVKKSKKAWDICPCNQVLNHYAGKLGRSFDDQGMMAREGTIDVPFLEALQQKAFFDCPPPKSLPNQFFTATQLDVVSPKVGLRTYTAFFAQQIAKDLRGVRPGRLLITGGGAFNRFLVAEIATHLPKWKTEVPSASLISFKEALIFAYLGLKKWRGEINVLCSVTGARTDSSSGALHIPK